MMGGSELENLQPRERVQTRGKIQRERELHFFVLEGNSVKKKIFLETLFGLFSSFFRKEKSYQ